MSLEGKVYFVEGPGRIKIGFTQRPDQRLVQLQSMDMEKLSMVGIVAGDRAFESLLHSKLDKHQMRGEWFRDCPEVRSLIEQVMSGKIKPAATISGPGEVDEGGDEVPSPLIYVVRSALKELERLNYQLQAGAAGDERTAIVNTIGFLAAKVIAPILHDSRPDWIPLQMRSSLRRASLAVEIAPEIRETTGSDNNNV
jgi:hypothetical protein